MLSMHRRAKMSDTVTLSIQGVRRSDQGSYECQVWDRIVYSQYSLPIFYKKVHFNQKCHARQGRQVV